MSTDRLLTFYRHMIRMRAVEQQLTTWSREGVLRGSLHLATGQEALPAGAITALRREDRLTVTYRGHGYVIAKDIDLGRILAEILGRRDGLCRGKGGKMHLVAPEVGLLGANGIVGAGVPIALGGGLEAKVTGSGLVALTVFGDGALNQGVVHESLNLAALWRLPVIFLCENNFYAEMTPLARSTPVVALSQRMAAYGIPAYQLDGNDPAAVYEAVSRAAERARSGEGPTFLEAMTYRTCGHYQADAETYRTRDEVAEWEAKSPLVRFEAAMKQAGISEDEMVKVQSEVSDEVAFAAAYALKSPVPDASELETEVFA